MMHALKVIVLAIVVMCLAIVGLGVVILPGTENQETQETLRFWRDPAVSVDMQREQLAAATQLAEIEGKNEVTLAQVKSAERIAIAREWSYRWFAASFVGVLILLLLLRRQRLPEEQPMITRTYYPGDPMFANLLQEEGGRWENGVPMLPDGTRALSLTIMEE